MGAERGDYGSILNFAMPRLCSIFQEPSFLAYEIVKLLYDDNNLFLLNFFSFRADKKHNAKHKIFEPRYDSQVIDCKKFFFQKLNYIHNNPCRSKYSLVDKPEDYKHSSASNYILEKGLYDVDLMDL